MRRLLLRWVANSVAAYAAMRLVTGFRVSGNWTAFAGLALILGLVNALIAPLLRLMTCPVIVATLGLFTLVINGAMLLLAARIATSLGLAVTVDSLWSAVLAALVISVVSTILSTLLGANRQPQRHR